MSARGYAADLEHLVADLITRADLPGVSLSVVDREGPLLALSLGSSDLANEAPVTPGTRFEIGSISKSFTALVVLSLVEEGRVDLDAAVTTYLPWFVVQSSFAPITVRHLLQHTSGLIAGSDALPDDYAQAWELRHTATGSAPGTFFHYSNAGYVVLGLVVEAVTGRTAAELVAERVLAPLHLTGSSAQVRHADRALMATGYQPLHDDRPWLPGDALIPATWFEVAAADGNVASTAEDLGRYLRMLLGRGTLDGTTIVSATSFDQMTQSLAPGGEPSEHPSRYGLGVNVETVDGNTCLTHGGGMVGYASFVLADLDAGLGIAVLTNGPGEGGPAELIARTGYALFRAEREGSAVPAVPGVPGVPGVPVVDPWRVADADRYVGTYTGAGRTFSVSADGLLLTLTDGALSGRLGWAGERLACTHPGWRTFQHELDGEGDQRRWTYGGTVLRPPATPRFATPIAVSPLVGHYRSYSPWYTNFRIVARHGELRLVAAGGVEGSRDDPLLVELSPGAYRIGVQPQLPERLVAGPAVDGRVIFVVRDGCTYSRTFTD